MSESVSPAALNQALVAAKAAFVRLIAILEDERKRLESGAVDSLESLARDKERCAQELAQESGAIDRFFASPLANPERLQPAAWIQARPAAERRVLEAAWQAMLEAAARARNLNELNGAHIQLQGQRVDAMLQALMRFAGQEATTYGRDGRTEAGPGTHLRSRG